MPHTPLSFQTCQDCGHKLHGRYCAHCGQSHTGHELGFHHAAEELLESLLHLDGRMLRTLRMLFLQPGALTHDYLSGRRTRHMPPLRLYLIISFILFLLMGLSKPEHRKPGDPKPAPKVILRVGPGGEEAARQVSKAASAEIAKAIPGELPKVVPGEGELQADEPSSPFEAKLKHAMEDTEAFRERMVHLGSRTAFLLLPVFAAMLWALFFRARRRFLEHVVFSLHFQSFAFGILALDLGLNLLPWKPLHTLGSLLFLALPLYFAMAIRRVYAQSLWKILWKGAFLSAAYFVLLLGVLAATFFWAVSA